MATNPTAAMKGYWLVLVAWVVIGAAAAPAMGQSCCRCDISGVPSSCNTGAIPNQAACESSCLSLPNELFGQFQTCPPGMVLEECSQDESTFCDAVCVQAAPAVAPAPTTSTTGTLIAMTMLIGLGGYRLRRAVRPTLSGRLKDIRE